MSYKTDRARFENARMDAEFERDCKNGTVGKVSRSGFTTEECEDLKKEYRTLTLESVKSLQEALDRIEKGDE